MKCCKDCEKRHVGCHNAEKCEAWAAHEELKKKRYAESEKHRSEAEFRKKLRKAQERREVGMRNPSGPFGGRG